MLMKHPFSWKDRHCLHTMHDVVALPHEKIVMKKKTLYINADEH